MERLCITKWFHAQKRTFLSVSSNVTLCKIHRFLSSAEVSTALRPFYFSVHPDLFGRFPAERVVNENSLQQLSSYLENLQQNRRVKPLTLNFFLRNLNTTHGKQFEGAFRTVRICLAEDDLRKAVISILKTCDLPTHYVDKIEPSQEKTKFRRLDLKDSHYYESDPIYTSIILKQKVEKTKEAEKLTIWLKKNIKEALRKLAAHQPVRDEIIKIQKALCESLGITSVNWDCGWNVTHFRGCLMSFQALARQHPNVMHNLKGRKLIFTNNTGISLDGDVMLNSGEVRHNWLDLIRNVHNQDVVLFRVPAFERAVSRVLCDIKVVRRKFQPKVIAKQYENQLRRLITSLSDYRGRKGYPKDWPPSLSEFELVVETEAGPLMLSPTGQFIVPSSCPAFLLVAFMSENLKEASELLLLYQSNKHVERELHHRCIEVFELAALQKDDNITPDLMIECCDRLLRNKTTLIPVLKGVHLWITHYYSVLSDGEMCIPWNWKL